MFDFGDWISLLEDILGMLRYEHGGSWRMRLALGMLEAR